MLTKASLGVSTVLATVILTSVLCVIVFTASYVANDAVNGQVENAQFNQAKNVMLALDKLIKRLMYKSESSGYVKTSFWTVTPYFTETGEKLELWIDGKKELEVPVNIVKIKGGPLTSVATDKSLIGDKTKLILTSILDSLGLVYVYQSAGAWISLDYSRVRCINAGTIQYYNGTGYEPYNFIEITVVNIMFKDFEVQEQASFTVKNKGLVPIQKDIAKGNNFPILVRKSGAEETLTLEQLGGKTDYRTLINLVVVNIEISILGGV